MPQYVIIAYDGTDAAALDRRMAARPAHLANVSPMVEAGSLKAGGAILDDAGRMIGSVSIADFPDREALDEQSETEVPVTEGGEVPVTEEGGAPAPTGRRVSEFHEIRDGGFGVGSAAPLEDGGQPMGHPIAAYRDTMTFRGPGDAGYEDTDPDVWFYDEGAAERSGFRRSEG